MTDAAAIEPDTKDWTWVVERPCPECGFDAMSINPDTIGQRIRENAAAWTAILAHPDAARRPEQDVWSATEYACHVRDVHRTFGERVQLMLDEDDPTFANWDQDETAIAERYDLQDPVTVAGQLDEAAGAVAVVYDNVADEEWQRPGRRSNGSAFTVASIGRYHLHDVVHHRWDVRALG